MPRKDEVAAAEVRLTANRAHRLKDSDYEYKMVFIEEDGSIAVVLPAGLYERMGKPSRLTVTIER